jgi:hypothetical protein
MVSIGITLHEIIGFGRHTIPVSHLEGLLLPTNLTHTPIP